MINKVLTKVFGTKHERDIKKLQPQVDAINALESEIKPLSDEELKAKTTEFRERLKAGETVEDLLIEAFAVVREAAVRSLEMRHYDVQLVGGIVLHRGTIAEMKTGEGKTLMSTLPVYLNALSGQGVHLVTVNDYLAARDSEWMGTVYRFLGLSVGVIVSDMPNEDRRAAYACDVTYGTNNEFGFDYLRDNMKFSLEQMVQRGHHYAIVDEVDSILIDEARTPLIISGPSEQSTEKYYLVDRIIPKLERGEEIEHEDGSKTQTGDFLVDEKAHTVALTDRGVASAEKLLNIDNLYDMANMDFLHAANQGLRAHHLFKKDVDYLIKEKKVVIVDEFTGRMMPGRRWSDGLHQAVEAKEGVKIEKENQTLATITFQNYFRMYEKLSGMTGTADTESKEFGEIYDLDVVVIPTNRPLIRDERGDLIYRSAKEKWNAVVQDLRDAHERGQPVLVGTVSIENSEMLSRLLKRARIPHVVLNAKYHEREASIVAQAGRGGSITIATNMAGRGTDIVLGGNPEGLALTEADPETEPEAYTEALERFEVECVAERQRVLDAGGLYILGTERHDSRRIDNQLRGRAGRQGDPGASRFYLSLEDDLMRIFVGNQWIQNYLMKHGMVEGEPLEHRMVSRAIEKAQTQVEAHNFDVRKHLLDYDDVMNRQREAIYSLRSDVLGGRTGRAYIDKISHDLIDYLIDIHCPEKASREDWELTELKTDYLAYFDINLAERNLNLAAKTPEEMRVALVGEIEAKYSEKENRHGDELIRQTERVIALQTVDRSWKDHLLALDHLKEGIGLRGYGQRDPKQEYKRESFDLFQSMKERIEDLVIKAVFRAEPITEEEYRARRRKMAEGAARRARLNFSAPAKTTQATKRAPMQIRKVQEKVGRNAPCPCGSGKKYKKCHGAA